MEPKRKKKKRTKKPLLDQKDRDPNRCIYFHKNKNRWCNQIKITTSEYCLHHASEKELEEHLEKKGKERIPCPLDPTHSIYKKNLNQHLKVCPKLLHINKKEEEYYESHLNTGGIIGFQNVNRIQELQKACDILKGEKKDITTTNENRKIHKKPQSMSPLAYIKSKYTVKEWKEKVNMLLLTYDTILKDAGLENGIEERILFVDEAKAHYKEENVALNKHLSQQASIIGQLKEHHCHSKECGYVEMGAGKAELSYMIYSTLNHHKQGSLPLPIDYLLIDRAAFKQKKDSQILYSHPQLSKKDKPMAHQSLLQRLRMDIRHLRMDGLKRYKHPKSNSVITSKHLCGVATDLTLSSLHHWEHPKMAKGMFIALCCHYLCTWEDYTNHAFLETYHIDSPEMFELIRVCTSWALIGDNNSTKHTPYLDFLSKEERVEFGWKCKRIFDLGRMMYLRSQGYHSYLVKYIDSNISPENVMLIAVPK